MDKNKETYQQSASSFNLKLKRLFIVLSTAFWTGCSLDVSLESPQSLSDISLKTMNRKEPDFIHGEVVTTSKGHQITGVFGEISEKTKAINNDQWEFEGVFYE